MHTITNLYGTFSMEFDHAGETGLEHFIPEMEPLN
jgi:hypothetical protein